MPEKPLFQHHVIHGRRGEGPTLLVIAGVHGDEFEGPAACRRLIAETDPDALSGNLHIIPMANESACRCRARCGSDGLDLARTFPGRADGSITERVAHALSGIIREASAFIDLHSGGTIMEVAPLSGYMLVQDAGVLERQRDLAKAFGLPLAWGTSASLDGRSMSEARDAGIPAIYAEYLGGARCSEEGVAAYVEGCRRVMAFLGMIDSMPPAPLVPQCVEDTSPGSGHMQICHPSPMEGIFVPAVQLGEELRRGQPLGVVVDYLGIEQRPIPAERDGRVIVLRTYPRVDAGESVGVIL